MYKYQEETFEFLEELRIRLEKLTEDPMSLKIGHVKDEYLNLSGTGYYTENRNLYFCINNGDAYTTFKSVGDIDSEYGISDDAHVVLLTNVFLILNEFIEKIYSNKREREQFYTRLNKELEAINKALK